jgi:hypothetical protein
MFSAPFFKIWNFQATKLFLQCTFWGACFELFRQIFGHLATVITAYSNNIQKLETK